VYLDEQPLHESRRMAKNLWQSYRIFRDRIELRTWFGRYTIPFDWVESVEISESLMKKLFTRGSLKFRGVKLDFADLAPHVVVHTNRGLLRSYHFTPDDLHEFVLAAQSARDRYPLLAERLQRDNDTPPVQRLNAR
jgi:hypothetical protein